MGGGFNGHPIVDYTTTHIDNHIVSNIFGENTDYYLEVEEELIGDNQSFGESFQSIITPHGIPFKNGFEIKMTQSTSETPEHSGVIVVYESYD